MERSKPESVLEKFKHGIGRFEQPRSSRDQTSSQKTR